MFQEIKFAALQLRGGIHSQSVSLSKRFSYYSASIFLLHSLTPLLLITTTCITLNNPFHYVYSLQTLQQVSQSSLNQVTYLSRALVFRAPVPGFWKWITQVLGGHSQYKSVLWVTSFLYWPVVMQCINGFHLYPISSRIMPDIWLYRYWRVFLNKAWFTAVFQWRTIADFTVA